MKKTKRLLSMLTALAITASSFAAMVIPASAEPDDPATPTWQIGQDTAAEATIDYVEKGGVNDALMIDDKNVYAVIDDVSTDTVEFKTDVYLDPAVAKNFRIVLQSEATKMYNTSTAFAQVAFNINGKVYTGPALGDTGTELFTHDTAGWYTFDITLDYSKKTENDFITLKVTNAAGEVQGQETKMGAIAGVDTTLKAIRLVATANDAYFANYTVTPGSVLASVATPEPDPTEDPSATEDPNAPTAAPFEGVEYDFEDAADMFKAGTDQFSTKLEKVEGDTVNTTTVMHGALDNQTGGRTAQLKFPNNSVITPGAKDVMKIDFDFYATVAGVNNTQDIMLVDSSSGDGKQIAKLTVNHTGQTLVNDTVVSGITSGKWYSVSAAIDFETKRIISFDFVDYSNKEAGIAAAVKDIPFVDSSVTDIGGITLKGNRVNNITSDVRIDNFKVSKVEGEHFLTTLIIKESNGTPVEGAEVTLGTAKYTTGADGTIITKLAKGEYEYTVKKAGYEAHEGQSDDATGTITITDAAVTENITYSKMVYTPVPGTVTMAGGQKVMTAPHSIETTTSAAYTVDVLDQNNAALTDADITWTVIPEGSETADPNVTIADGVVTVKKGYNAGDTHVKNFTVTATASKNGGSKSASAVIAVSDYLFYEPGVGASSYGSTNMAHRQDNGTVVSGDDNLYIATPATKGTVERIALPDPIEFTKGTAQLLSFKTTVQEKTGYTFKRTVSVVGPALDAESQPTEKAIAELGYINLDIGDAATADWNTSTCTFATTWGSMSALNEWIDVSMLFKTNANGITNVVLTVGDKEYELGATDVTGINAITTLLDLNNVNRYALLKDIVISEVDVSGMEIDGPDKFSTISDKTITKEYAVDAMVIEDGETFTWSTDIEGATIAADPEDSQKAVLTVPGTVTKGGKITLTSSVSTPEKPKTATLDVEIAPAEIVSVNIEGTPTLNKTDETATYTVSDLIDQYGDDVTEYFTPVWSLKAQGSGASGHSEAKFTVSAADAGEAVAIKAVYDGSNLKSATTEKVTLTEGENTIEAPAGTKVMLWKALDGENALKPIAPAQTAAAVADDGGDDEEITNATIDPVTGVVTIKDIGDIAVTVTFKNGSKEFSFSKDVTIGTFSAVVDAAEGTTTVDISAINDDAMITGYQVTVAKDNAEVATAVAALDGTAAQADVSASVADDKVTVTGTEVGQKVEVTPIYEGVIGDTFNIPGGRYNITVVAGTADRTDVYANDQLIINNLNQGSDNWSVGRTKVDNTEYVAGDVVINEGSAVFNLRDDKGGTGSAKQIKVVKAPSIVDRAQRVYVIGDSLVAKYYGNAPEGQEALVRTGWGDVLADYLVDTVNVTNLGNSGAWAEGMLSDAFTNVKMSGQPGDILVLESGYNDGNHTSMEVMRNSIKAMVDGAKANGMTVFVVTPNASNHSDGEYAGNVASSADVRVAAEESEAILIDLAANSGKFFSKLYGDSHATAATTLEKYYNNVNDKLHSSYNAANCWAAIVAQGLYDNEATKAIVDVTHTYHFDDGTEAGVTVGVNNIPGVTTAE